MLRLLIWYILATGAIKVAALYFVMSIAAQLTFVFWFCFSVWLVAFLDLWTTDVSMADTSDTVEDTGWYHSVSTSINAIVHKIGMAPVVELVLIIFPYKTRWLLKSAIVLYVLIGVALTYCEQIDVDGLEYRYKIVYMYTPMYLVMVLSFVDSMMFKYTSKKHSSYHIALYYRTLDPTWASEYQLEVADKFLSANKRYMAYADSEEEKFQHRQQYAAHGLPMPDHIQKMMDKHKLEKETELRDGTDHVSRIRRKKPHMMTKW
jgi:hypothetical protein